MNINVNLKILKEVMQNQKFMYYVKDKLKDLNFSGLTGDQIAKIEYAYSIYVRQKHIFEKLEDEINHEESLLERLEKTIKKILFIKPGELKIKSQSEMSDFLKFLHEFKTPDLKKDEKGEQFFTLYHNADLILEGSIKYYEYKGKISMSVNHVHQGDFIYGPFNFHLDDYYEKIFKVYLEANELETISQEIQKKLNKLQSLIYAVEVESSKSLLAEINEIFISYIDTPIYFNFLSKKESLEKKIKDLGKISDPNMSMVDRIFQCKNWQCHKHLVVPGEGKKCVIAIHGIYFGFKTQTIILNILKNNGYGGSILIFEGVGIGPLEQFLIREKKLGVIIHNIGTWHESTLHEILGNSTVSQEERDYCFSIPHNDMGENGSENLLCSKDFMEKVKNFI